MRPLMLAALLMIVTHGALAQSERIVTRTFAGVAVRLVIPPGYCLIERDSSQGKLFYDLQEKGNLGINVVAAMFADCKEWAKRQATPSYRVRRHGSYLFQLTDSKETLIPAMYSREKYLRELTQLELRGLGLGSDASRDKINRTVNQRIKEAEVKTASSVGQLNIGLIAVNEHALFYGMGATLNYSTESPRMSNVVAMTLVNGVPISINIYADYDPKGVFRRLLNQQKRNAERLVKANR